MVDKRLESWAVAVAVLLENQNRAIHIEDLAQQVVDCGLTTLGMRGNTRPRQSLGSQLTNGLHSDEFERSEGYYWLASPGTVESHHDVKLAIQQFKSWKSEQAALQLREEQLCVLRQENLRLADENAKLRECLTQISALCQPVAMSSGSRDAPNVR